MGVYAVADNGYGGQFKGGLAPLRLSPATSGTGHPTSGNHVAGELYVDSAGSLFYCTTAGTPGTWVPLPGSGSGGPFVTLGATSSSANTTEVDLTGSAANATAFKVTNQSTGTGGFGLVSIVSAPSGYGVFGYSTYTGVLGVAVSVGGNGVYGAVGAAGGAAIVGTTNLSGTGNNNRAFAGYFDGNFAVANGFKSAVVPHPDGSHRLLYCMESPESWFEDFGKGTLVADKAEVKLDADFAALVHTDDYHVFLTAHGPQHLHVEQQGAAGFTVVAMAWAAQAGGPKRPEGGGTFSYRVVAKRKDIKAERLAKFDLPKKMDLPKAPELPKK